MKQNVFLVVSTVILFLFCCLERVNGWGWGIPNVISKMGMEETKYVETGEIDLSRYTKGTLCYYKFHLILFYRVVNKKFVPEEMKLWPCIKEIEYTPCKTSDQQEVDYQTWRLVPFKFTKNFNNLMENAVVLLDKIGVYLDQTKTENHSVLGALRLYRLLYCLHLRIMYHEGYGDLRSFDEEARKLLQEVKKLLAANYKIEFGEEFLEFGRKECETADTYEYYWKHFEEEKSRWYNFNYGK